MNGIWAAVVESVEPICLNCPPSSVAAFWPPLAAASKYGLLIAFGMKTMFRFGLAAAPLPAALAAALGAALAATDGAATDGAAAEAAADGLAPPPLEHAANARTATVARATIRPLNVCFKVLPPRLRVHAWVRDLTVGNRLGRWWAPSARPFEGRSGLVSKGGNDDRDDEQQPDGDALELGRDVGEPEDVAEDGERGCGEHDAGDRPRAAEDIHATEQHDRDDRQGHALAEVRPGAREAAAQDDAGERCHGPGQDEEQELEPGDPDTRVAGRRDVLA